jgi:DNA-binding IclR family transcriptional regulator
MLMMTFDDQPTPGRRQAGVIGAVANALELMQLFAGGRAVQVNQASRTLGLSRSTVHRLLATLMVYGYVEQDPSTKAYLPGPALTGMGLATVQGGAVSAQARGALTALADATRDTVHVMVLRGDHVLCLDSVESPQPVRTPSRIGWNLPSHSTAGGKALLAELSDAEVEAIFPDPIIHGLARTSPLRRVDLLADLELVRARGYATNFGESEPYVTAVAAVLRDGSHHAIAALSVTAPRSRGDEEWVKRAGRIVLDIADGYRLSVA